MSSVADPIHHPLSTLHSPSDLAVHPHVDTGIGALVLEQLEDLLGALVAEELAELFLVPRNAMGFDQCQESCGV